DVRVDERNQSGQFTGNYLVFRATIQFNGGSGQPSRSTYGNAGGTPEYEVLCSAVYNLTADDRSAAAEQAFQLLARWNGDLNTCLRDPWHDPFETCGVLPTIANYGDLLAAACGGSSSCLWADTDGDGVGDLEDPEPQNPQICGDWNGDGFDDCATEDGDGDGVPDVRDPCPANDECCGDWNGDGLDDCAPGSPKCANCKVACGSCCWGVQNLECGIDGDPLNCRQTHWYCCGCSDGCTEDPNTPEQDCQCIDDPATDINECQEGAPGCECRIGFEAFKQRLTEAMESIGLPVDRVFPEIDDYSFTITIPFVNIADGVEFGQVEVDLLHDFSGLNSAATILNDFRVPFRSLLGLALALSLTFRALKALNYGG
nr:hypothetical protein [Planctomycetota bacterium]